MPHKQLAMRPESIATSQPVGSQVIIEYRGAQSATGSNPGPWSTSIDSADGAPFLQYRVTLIADVSSGQAPSVDAIVVPIN